MERDKRDLDPDEGLNAGRSCSLGEILRYRHMLRTAIAVVLFTQPGTQPNTQPGTQPTKPPSPTRPKCQPHVPYRFLRSFAGASLDGRSAR